MEEKNLTDEQSDLLIEFDGYGFEPTILMPNAEGYAKAWKNSLIDLFNRLNFLQAEQQAEIERLKNAYREGLEQGKFDSQQEIERLTEENAELQKKVDELEDICLDCPYKLKFDEIEKQAVKDTAKEIYSEINSCIEQGQEYCGLDWRGLLTAKTLILVYCKKNGVEVE